MSLIAIILLVLIFCAIYIGIVWFTKYNSSRHWSSIPGFCMGIGIGITFLSMYRTFQNFKKGNEIENLIPEISSAFIGSLLGLSISLLMTYWIKSRIAAIEEIEQKQAGENNNPYKLLQEIAGNTKKLNTAFDTFNIDAKNQNVQMLNDFSTQFQGIMDSVKTDAIGQSLKNINLIHEQLSGKLETIFRTTNGTISKGQTDLNTSVDALKTTLESKIGEINSSTDTIQDKIVNMGNNITEKVDVVISAKIENLEATFERIEKYQRRSETILKEATHKFGKSVTQVEYINDRRKEEFDQLEKQSKTLDETIKTTNQVYENWRITIDSVKEIETKLASINNVIKNIDELNSKFRDCFPSTQQNLNNDVQ